MQLNLKLYELTYNFLNLIILLCKLKSGYIEPC